MRKPKNICHHLQDEINHVSDRLLSECSVEYDSTGIKGFVTNTRRGFARFDGQFTVPLWAYNKGIEYFTYYVAHELAHQLRFIKYDKKGHHDFNFYEIFMNICPKSLQKFELNYKKSASQYGI